MRVLRVSRAWSCESGVSASSRRRISDVTPHLYWPQFIHEMMHVARDESNVFDKPFRIGWRLFAVGPGRR